MTRSPRGSASPEYRQQLTSSFRDARRFWDLKSDDIQLMAMHGKPVLQDPAGLARLLDDWFGFEPTGAATYGQFVTKDVAQITALQGGDNPIFTLNAFAFSAEGEPAPFDQIPGKRIFGDGILDALEFMKIADVEPRAVLGHEFGHHVQFEKNRFDSPLTGAEATRRTEPMADSFGTYFTTHSRGLALNSKRVLQGERTFYEVGDCSAAPVTTAPPTSGCVPPSGAPTSRPVPRSLAASAQKPRRQCPEASPPVPRSRDRSAVADRGEPVRRCAAGSRRGRRVLTHRACRKGRDAVEPVPPLCVHDGCRSAGYGLPRLGRILGKS